MTDARSANEIAALVLKAARGGDLPLGLAEDLAAATAFLDLDALDVCPCRADGAAFELPHAIDAVLAHGGAQRVVAPKAVVAAYCAAVSQHNGATVGYRVTADGCVIEPSSSETLPFLFGRRTLPAALQAHLNDMASKTLVPESDASRQAGAGAGLTDND